MSFVRCMGMGFLGGTTAGLVSACYFSGLTERLDRQCSPLTYLSFFSSLGSIPAGMVGGTAAGAGYYGLKKSVKFLKTAPLAVRFLAGSAVAGGIAYQVGKS